VSGIFSSSGTNSTRTSDDTVVVALPTEQRLSGQSGDVTSAIATVDSLDNLNTATNEIKQQLGSNADVTSSLTQANNAVQPLNSVKSISVYSLIGAIIAGGIIILLTMVMIVRERTREIGVIKAIGASNLKIAWQFMTEATTLTVVGAVLGVILAAFAANPITHFLVNSSSTSTSTTISAGAGPGGTSFSAGGGAFGGSGQFRSGRGAVGFLKSNFGNIHAAVGWDILIYGLLAAIVIAIIGSAAVSFFIAKIRPAEVMRTE
jgi:putative ABC transport system permease protein